MCSTGRDGSRVSIAGLGKKWPVGLVVEKKIYFSLLNLFVAALLVCVSQMQQILVKLDWSQTLKWSGVEWEPAWGRAGQGVTVGSHLGCPRVSHLGSAQPLPWQNGAGVTQSSVLMNSS